MVYWISNYIMTWLLCLYRTDLLTALIMLLVSLLANPDSQHPHLPHPPLSFYQQSNMSWVRQPVRGSWTQSSRDFYTKVCALKKKDKKRKSSHPRSAKKKKKTFVKTLKWWPVEGPEMTGAFPGTEKHASDRHVEATQFTWFTERFPSYLDYGLLSSTEPATLLHWHTQMYKKIKIIIKENFDLFDLSPQTKTVNCISYCTTFNNV